MASSNPWVEARVAEIESLCGARVDGWAAVEMAFREDPAQFVEPGVDCLQLLTLHAKLEYRTVAFSTYQDDHAFGLRLDAPVLPLDPGSWQGIYRFSDNTSLPTGLLERVSVGRSERGNIREITLTLGGEDLVLLAAEVYEDHDGSLFVCLDDASVLAFRSRQSIAALNWRGPRPF